MRLGSILKLVAVAAMLLVVALVAVVKSIDVNAYRPLLAQAAQAATGRALEIRGPIRLHLSLSPRLTAEDLVLANAPSTLAGVSPRPMLTVKGIEAEIGLLPLLFREISLHRLVLVEPDLLLERDAKGQPNWTAGNGTPLPDPAAAGIPTRLHIAHLRIDKGRLTYRDGRSGRSQMIGIGRLTADADTLIAPIGLHLDGSWNGIPLDLSGVIGPLADLLTPPRPAGKPYPLKLKAVMPALVASLDGSLADNGNGLANPLLDLNLSADSPELADLVQYTGTSLPALGAVRLSFRLSGTTTAPAVSGLDFALGRKDSLALTVKGGLHEVWSGRGVDLLATLEGPGLAGLGKSLDLPLPPVGTIHLTGHIKDVPGGWRLGELKAVLGHSDLAGEATLRRDGPRPALELRLASTLVDLGELADRPHSDSRTDNRPEAVRLRTGDHLFSDDPLPFALLSGLDGRLLWKIDRLTTDAVEARKLDIEAKLTDGRLTLTPTVEQLAGGRLTGSLSVDSTARPPTVALRLDADQLDLGALLKGLHLSAGLSGARTSLRLVAQGSGLSPHALMARLNGEAVVITGQTHLDTAAIGSPLATDLFRQLAPWAEGGDTDVKCLIGRFIATDGLAKSETLLFDTGPMTVSGHGSINLGQELLDLTLAPRPKETRLLAQTVPLDLGGTLRDPQISPNRGTMVQNLAGPAGGWSLGPLAPLLPLADPAGTAANPCIAALHPPPPPSTSRAGKNGKKK